MQKEYLIRREKIATNKIFNQEWILAASWWMESILTQDEHEFEIEEGWRRKNVLNLVYPDCMNPDFNYDSNYYEPK